jgi:MFS family permease
MPGLRSEEARNERPERRGKASPKKRPAARGTALHSRNFRLLLGCDIISIAGTAVAVVAIPFAVLAIGGSASDVGYVSVAALLPMIAFLLLGGVVADRLPRHRVMMAADALQCLAQAASAAIVLAGVARIWELAALAALRGLGMGFFYPAVQGLLPQTVPPAQRAQAIAIDRIGRNGGQIGGAALGGLLVGVAGPGWGLAIDAASFAAAVALRAGMRFPASTRSIAPVSRTNILHELREGWRDFISRRWLWSIVAQFGCLIAIFTAASSVLGPVIAHTRLGGAGNWGLILAASGVGALAGGLLMLKFRPQRMLLVATLAVFPEALYLFALAVPVPVPLIMAVSLITGVGLTVFGVNWATTMQQEIPPDMLSRLSSYDALGSFALAPVGALVAGPLADVFGPGPVLVVGGVLVIFLTAAVLFVPEVRHLTRAPAPAATQEHGALSTS